MVDTGPEILDEQYLADALQGGDNIERTVGLTHSDPDEGYHAKYADSPMFEEALKALPEATPSLDTQPEPSPVVPQADVTGPNMGGGPS